MVGIMGIFKLIGEIIIGAAGVFASIAGICFFSSEIFNFLKRKFPRTPLYPKDAGDHLDSLLQAAREAPQGSATWTHTRSTQNAINYDLLSVNVASNPTLWTSSLSEAIDRHPEGSTIEEQQDSINRSGREAERIVNEVRSKKTKQEKVKLKTRFEILKRN